ncbi:transmembrane protein 252 [Carlito syrichta]|uniref:Transmembrane protein 252 n=1 Tax=Carlito syrichta TaxID=1868482 RepID=A0A1U7UEG0_CARSF|nr:transmembrane protein 252 [Carlito syrichta]
MQNRTGLILCASALLTGFLMVCLGAFFISSGSIHNCWERLIMAYLLLPLGFVILLNGMFWSTYCQASESKRVFSHVLRQHLAHGALPLATVDRPDFYPPAYEESLDVEKQICPAEGEASDLPPPLYTEMGLDFQDDNDGHPEAPPSYSESIADLAAAATSEDAQRQSRGEDLQHSSWPL